MPIYVFLWRFVAKRITLYSFVKECKYFTTSWSPSKCIDAFKCNLSPPNDTVSQPSTHKRKSFFFQKKFTEHLVFRSIIISLLVFLTYTFHFLLAWKKINYCKWIWKPPGKLRWKNFRLFSFWQKKYFFGTVVIK